MLNTKKILNILKNRYVIAILVFVAWVGFIDHNNMVRTSKNRKELRELKDNKAYYLKEIEETKRIREELLNNRESLEKFAREEYFMKKKDDDIFVVEFED